MTADVEGSDCGQMSSAIFDVFISYAGQDKKKYILPLAEALGEDGIRFWLDEYNIMIGDSVSMEINEGLRRSRYVLLCLSEAFLGRPWPESELGAALAIQNRLGQKRVLPVILNSADKIFAHYPLLADKCYVKGDIPKRVAKVVFNLLTMPENILKQPNLEVDAEVSDYLAMMSKRGKYVLAVEDFLVGQLAVCSDDTQRYWLYYTLGRIGGSRAYHILKKAMFTEQGLSLKGVKEGQNFFSETETPNYE